MDKIILVFYVGVGNIEPTQVDSYVQEAINLSKLNNENIIQFYIPTRNESKIECIYPNFIMDSELKERFDSVLTKLEEQLKENE